MIAPKVPECGWALIGGSGTHGCSFPEDAGAGARVIERNLVFQTPYGESPSFILFETQAGKRCLTVRLHGWRPGVMRGDASRQVFWVLAQARVRRIFSEAAMRRAVRLAGLR